LRGDLPAFEAAAGAFLKSQADPRHGGEEMAAGDGRVSLFHSREAEMAMIARSRAWRITKYDAGYGWITGPLEFGGAGLGPEFEAAYDRLEGDYDVPRDECFAPGLEFVGPAILAYGQERARAELLPAIYRGEILCCQLFSEPNAGSDLASLTTRAVQRGATWVVNGQKVWTSRAHVADIGVLLARTGTEAERHRGITAFVVDLHSPGVTVRPLRQMTGDAPFNEVFFDDAEIADHYRLGEVGGGWVVAMSALADERSAISRSARYRPGGLAALASPERLLALADRRGLRADPVVRQELAGAYIRYCIAAWTVERLRYVPPTDWAAPVAPGIGKLRLARQLSASADLVCRLLGPHITAAGGEAWADGWVPFVLGVPGPHIGGGTDEVILNSIAERGLGLPRDRRP
jgi:alkylation response protein AidB-like acyl-CoA dehydrogenase